MKPFRAALAAMVVLACGPAQGRPHAERVTLPDSWEVVPGTTRLLTSLAAPEVAFAEQEIRYVRTGRFSSAVSYGGLIGAGTIAAGSPAYAVSLAGYGVGWCAPGGSDRDLKARLASTNKERCIFRDRKGRPFQTQGYSGKSPFASPNFTGMYKTRSELSVDEKPVDLARRFTLRAAVEKISGNRLWVRVSFDDGENQSRLVSLWVPPNPQGSYDLALWGGTVRLTPEGTAYRVEAVRSLTDTLSPHPLLRGIRVMDGDSIAPATGG